MNIRGKRRSRVARWMAALRAGTGSSALTKASAPSPFRGCSRGLPRLPPFRGWFFRPLTHSADDAGILRSHSSVDNMPVVQLLHTCLVNEFAPEVAFAVVRVLRRLGYEVQVPLDQTCCGQPAFNAGFQDPARAAARHTITTLERTEGPIVIPSGSCGDMVIHQYVQLFQKDDSWRARAKADRRALPRVQRVRHAARW